MHLLDAKKYPALIKCLLGLAMLLPQAESFHVLNARIQLVQATALRTRRTFKLTLSDTF